jgi:ubiquinone/menaquinone biosynthesis C-methylase UbiE
MRFVVLIIAALAAWGARAWMRERRAHTVFDAGAASSLLHPARRLIQPPDAIVRAVDIAAGQRVLEVGPGPGYFTLEAARAVGDDGCVVCVDVQRGMVDALMRRLDGDPASRVRAVVGDATRLPLRDATFDRAFMVAVLGETPSPEGVMAELRRVLRPGGVASFGETLTDPDYVREGVLRRMGDAAGLQFAARRQQLLGYVMSFERAE